jgi:hypothetical protein
VIFKLGKTKVSPKVASVSEVLGTMQILEIRLSEVWQTGDQGQGRDGAVWPLTARFVKNRPAALIKRKQYAVNICSNSMLLAF